MQIPRHIVLFPDGNGRWAKKNRVSRLAGYKKGYENLFNFVGWCKNRGVRIITIFGFTTENWKRGKKLVNFLMRLFEGLLLANINKYMNSQEFREMGVRIRVIGQRERLSKSLQRAILKAEEITKDNKDIILNLAVSYGGKWDILTAVKKIIQEKISGDKVDEQLFESYLSTAGLPDPDFIIRTGGGMRLSNFALWQSAYSELYFSPKLWPDFTEQDFDAAIKEYASRTRSFGK